VFSPCAEMTYDYTRQPMDRSLVAAVARLPEVAAWVVTDHVGALLASSGELDGEAIGCVHAVAVRALAACGDALGLGTLHRVTIAGTHYGCVIAIDDREVLGVYVDPSQALDALESQLDTARGR
jgi:predicted regulator of Ras-like GTPase activity (Roadblock/LC7/MglB family)